MAVCLFLCWRRNLWTYLRKYSSAASLVAKINGTDIARSKYKARLTLFQIYLRNMFPLDVRKLRHSCSLSLARSLVLQVHLWYTASLAGIHTNDCQMICAWSQSNHSITLPVSAFWLFNYQLNAFKKAQTYGTLYELASLSNAKRNWCYI